MNKEQVEGKVDQLSAGLKKTWAKLTDNDVLLYKADREKFFGKVKELHGDAREAAEKKITELQKASDSSKAA